MTVEISKGAPQHFSEWESLCLATGNFLASHYYCQVNSIYDVVPWYITVLNDKSEVVAGCKVDCNKSRKLPVLLKGSKTANMYGDYLLRPVLTKDETSAAIGLINRGMARLLKQNEIIYLSVYGHYGIQAALYPAALLDKVTYFNIGLLDLRQSNEVLWEGIHSKHRNVIKKAEKDGVVISHNGSYAEFKKLLNETYARQNEVHGPSEAFLDAFYSVTHGAGQCKIYSAYYNGILTGCALIHVYGTYADYAFAGSNNLHNGANTLMQWKIMIDLKAAGCTTYNLGEIADEQEDYGNEKYSSGISRFKMRFGCNLYKSYYGSVVLSPVKYALWKTLVKLRNKI